MITRLKLWLLRNISEYSLIDTVVSRILEACIIAVMLYYLYDLCVWILTWWHPNYAGIEDYLDVKLPQVIIGVINLLAVPWLVDLLTPGSYQRKIHEDPTASAIFMSSVVIGLSFILSR